MNTRAESIARHMWDARRTRQNYANLPDALTPTSIAEAYAAQEAYWRLAEPVYGPVAGVKVATTTKVMQQLMASPTPAAGRSFQRRFTNRQHASEKRNSSICESRARLR